jgi:hypothetical protein
MDVCRNAAPHVGTCVGVPSSWNHDTHLFRTKAAQEHQSGLLRAKLVICDRAVMPHRGTTSPVNADRGTEIYKAAFVRTLSRALQKTQ